MRHAAFLVLVLFDCGTASSVTNTIPPDAMADVVAEPFPVSDASTIDVQPISCEAGTERVRVDTSSGTDVLTLGCGDAGVPAAMMQAGGEDQLWSLHVRACGAGDASVEVEGAGLSPSGATGTFGSPFMIYDGLQSWGTITVTTWADAGELVSGTFAPGSKAPTMSGAFCVRRIQ